jgi:hypothetical protein
LILLTHKYMTAHITGLVQALQFNQKSRS